jgi:hypothetical protein
VAVEFGIITSVVPPGGWTYPQVLSSGQTIKIEGFSFEQLLEAMLDFRRRHLDLAGGAENANIEAVRRDLKAYFCAHFKANCADSPTVPAQQQGIGLQNSYVRPIDRAANWLAKRAQARVDLVDMGLASNRAHVCAQCPQNVRWATSCAPCNDNVLVRAQQMKGNQRTQFDPQLFMCRVWGHINSVAVWMTDTQTTPEHDAPANCWHLTENGDRTNT